MTKGEPLVQLDDRDYEAALARAEAGPAARARPTARCSARRSSAAARLRSQDVASQEELDVKENELARRARRRPPSCEPRSTQAKVNLDYTVAARADATA